MLTQFVEIIRPYAELLYFLSGVGLLIVAVYGLKQLHLLKEDIRTRNTRAACEKALEAATIFAREFIPNYNKYYLSCKQANLSSYTGSIGDFSCQFTDTRGEAASTCAHEASPRGRS
jgi:hypothetical protein